MVTFTTAHRTIIATAVDETTIKSSLTAEVMGALCQRPDLRIVKVVDGAADNWSYLGETLPFGEKVLDFQLQRDSGCYRRSQGPRPKISRDPALFKV
jgi:hypothetical protein